MKPNELEKHLSDGEFMVKFKMDKEAYAKLAPWKQQNLKKRCSSEKALLCFAILSYL